MPTAYMISSRNRTKEGFGDRRAPLAFHLAEDGDAGRLADPAAWEQVSAKAFRDALIERALSFPVVPADRHEEQRHVTLLVHGAGGWADNARRYAELRRRLYVGDQGLGALVLYAWPADAMGAGCGPDREEARASGSSLAEIVVDLHEHLVAVQRRAERSGDPADACRAKTSMVAQGVGAYVAQKALAVANKRLHSPERISLINQLVLVGADVDNDLFLRDHPGDSDGPRMANLCYRIASLYTGRDQCLGAPAGLRHFGRRRLGRSGLADRSRVFDNVFDIDVSALVEAGRSMPDALLAPERGRRLLRLLLQGVDREHIRGEIGDSEIVLY